MYLFNKKTSNSLWNSGDVVSGEITEYELAYYGDDVSCRLNERNTCKRALCECDLEFARGLPDQIDSYSDDFHTYWSPEEYKWNPKEDCVKRKMAHNLCALNWNRIFRRRWSKNAMLWWYNKSILHNKSISKRLLCKWNDSTEGKMSEYWTDNLSGNDSNYWWIRRSDYRHRSKIQL